MPLTCLTVTAVFLRNLTIDMQLIFFWVWLTREIYHKSVRSVTLPRRWIDSDVDMKTTLSWVRFLAYFRILIQILIQRRSLLSSDLIVFTLFQSLTLLFIVRGSEMAHLRGCGLVFNLVSCQDVSICCSEQCPCIPMDSFFHMNCIFFRYILSGWNIFCHCFVCGCIAVFFLICDSLCKGCFHFCILFFRLFIVHFGRKLPKSNKHKCWIKKAIKIWWPKHHQPGQGDLHAHACTKLGLSKEGDQLISGHIRGCWMRLLRTAVCQRYVACQRYVTY